MDLQTLRGAQRRELCLHLTGEDPVTRRLFSRRILDFNRWQRRVGHFSTWTISEPPVDSYAGNAFHRHDHWADAFGRGTITSADLPANALNYYWLVPSHPHHRCRSVRFGRRLSLGQARVPSAMHRWEDPYSCREQRVGGSLFAAAGMLARIPRQAVHWLRGRQ